MPFFTIDHRDGRYSLGFPVPDEEGPERAKRGEAVFFSADFMKAQEIFWSMDAVFQTLFRLLDNECHVQRREDELRPLEDSERMAFQERIYQLEDNLNAHKTELAHERNLRQEAQHELFELEMKQG